MFCLMWGGIGISMFFFSLLLFSIWLSLFRYEDNQNIYSFIYPSYLLWFCFVVGMGRYRYIYLPPPKRPPFGARVDHMVQIPHDSQLNKIRILFNSPSLYTNTYTYISVYHCIPCIHSSAYQLHLSLKPDCYTIYKRAYAPLYTPCHSQAPEHGRDMPGKTRKSADTGRHSTRYIWYKIHHFSHSAKKIASITVSYG